MNQDKKENIAQMLWCHWMNYTYPDERWSRPNITPGLTDAVQLKMRQRANQICQLIEDKEVKDERQD